MAEKKPLEVRGHCAKNSKHKEGDLPRSSQEGAQKDQEIADHTYYDAPRIEKVTPRSRPEASCQSLAMHLKGALPYSFSAHLSPSALSQKSNAQDKIQNSVPSPEKKSPRQVTQDTYPAPELLPKMLLEFLHNRDTMENAYASSYSAVPLPDSPAFKDATERPIALEKDAPHAASLVVPNGATCNESLEKDAAVSDLSELWALWCHLSQSHFGQGPYKDWLSKVSPLSWDDGILSLGTPSAFVAQWIETHYLEGMMSMMQPYAKTLRNIILKKDAVRDQSPAQTNAKILASDAGSHGQDGEAHSPASLQASSQEVGGQEEEDGIQSSPLDSRFTFDQFVVGKPNEFAYAAARRVAESAETIYNPLFLYGPVGHGKTHLMHSIAHAIFQRSGGTKTILYLSAEKFMYYFVRALRYRNVMAFKERFRSVDVLMIDDVQFISGKDSTQEEFFHTFNSLVDARRQVVISADKSPSDLEGIQERMRSRLGWGLAVDLHPTTYELRLGILHAKAAQHGYDVGEDILSFLAEHVASSVRELEGALTRIVAHSSLIGKPLTIDFVRTVLRDVLRPAVVINLEVIERKVCEHFHIRLTDLHSAKRTRNITRPRQIAMFLTKSLTSTSLPAIGRHFGGRDHTTVLHAINAIEALLKTCPDTQQSVFMLRGALGASTL